MAARAATPNPGIKASSALNLGWLLTEVYNYDRIPGEGEGTDRTSLVGLGRLTSKERAALILRQVSKLVADLAMTMPWVDDAAKEVAGNVVNVKKLRDLIWSGHRSLLVEITVADARLGRSYGLGRELAETTLLAPSDDRAAIIKQFNQNRLETIQTSLRDLADCFPCLSAGTVATSLELWNAWSETIESTPDWDADQRRRIGQALRQQDSRWLALLEGETDPKRSLTPAHYLAAGRRLLAGLAELVRGLIADSWPVRLSLLITLGLAVVVLLLAMTGHTPSILAGSVVFLGSLVTSAAGLASVVRQGVSQLSTPLWERELEAAMAEANSFVPNT